jgi:hypothetical protein
MRRCSALTGDEHPGDTHKIAPHVESLLGRATFVTMDTSTQKRDVLTGEPIVYEAAGKQRDGSWGPIYVTAKLRWVDPVRVK